jgi:hypothetical protein
MLEKELEGIIESILLNEKDGGFCCKLLLTLTFSLSKPDWIQELCHKIILNDGNTDLTQLAITCLGHLGRMHGETFDKEKSLSFLNGIKHDDKYSDIKYFRGVIDDAIVDMDN